MGCRIQSVLAPNGEPSILFRNLQLISKDASQAMELYLQVKGIGLGDIRVDANGEAQIEEVMEYLQGITEETRSEFYSTRPDLSIATMSPEIEAIMVTIENHIQEARRKADGVRTVDLHNYWAGRAEALDKDRAMLVEYQSVQAITMAAERQLAHVKLIAEKSDPNQAEIVHSLDIAKGWFFDNMREFLTDAQLDTENPTNQVFQEISGQAEALYNQLISIARNDLKTYIEDRRGYDVGDLSAFPDISTATLYTLDMSHADNPVVSTMFTQLARAARNYSPVIAQIEGRLAELSAGVDASRLLQRNEKGETTGTLIMPYSHRYYSESNRTVAKITREIEAAKRKSPADAKKSLRFAFSEYYAKRRNLEVAFDTRFFIDPKFKTSRFKNTAAYEKYLIDQFGEERFKEIKAEAQELLKRFTRDRDINKLRFEGEVATGVADLNGRTGVEYVEERLKDWDTVNSPHEYHREANAIRLAEYKNREGWRYVVKIPLVKDAKGKSSGFYDESFDSLTEDERALHTEIFKVLGKMKQLLPRDVVATLEENFLPVINKSLVEVYTQDGMKAASRFLADKAFDAITGEEAELMDGMSAGRKDLVSSPHAPLRYISKPKNDGTESIDPVRLTEMFAHMALNYAYKSDVEDIVRLGQAIIREAREIKTKGGKPLLDKRGRLVTIENGLPNLTKGAEYMIEAGMEGLKRKQKEYQVDHVLYSRDPAENSEKKKAAAKIREKRDEAEIALEDGTIDQEEYDDRISDLEELYHKLGGKNLVYGGFVEGVLAYAQLKGMGFNMVAGTTNIIFGFVSNSIHAAGNTDFNDKQLAAATWAMLKSRTAHTSKVARLVLLFDVLFEVDEIAYGKAAERREYRMLSSLKSPYEIQRRTEFIIQGASLIAQMLNTPVTDLAGVERNLFDAFNEDGTWNEKEFGEPGEWESILETGTDENKFTNFREKVTQVNKALHGNYDPTSPILAKKFLIGRLLFMFRSWLPEGIAWRFQKERWDDQMGRMVKGRYISVIDIVKDHGLLSVPRAFMNAFLKNKDAMYGGEKLSDLDFANLRSNLREMEIAVGLVASMFLMMMMLADEDDDDEPRAWAARLAFTQANRVMADLTFYTTPEGMSQVVNNPVPAWSALTSGARLIGAAWDMTTDEEMTTFDGLDKIGRNLPIVNQVFRVYEQATTKVDNEDAFGEMMPRDVF